MNISMTEFRNKMFQIMPKLKSDEEVIITHNGKESYILKCYRKNRVEAFKKALSKCPSLQISDNQLLAFKKEGRK